MRIYRLDKSVLILRNNVGQFLNGLSANSLDRLRNAFVNQHGRVIATFDQIKTGEDEFLIVVDSSVQANLTSHIQKFLLLNKTSAGPTDRRVYFDLDNAYKPGNQEYAIPQRAGQMILTLNELEVNVTEDEFTLFRLKNNIPLLGVDYQKDEFLLNVDEHEFVSYTKGCFLGQEPIAKVHNRSQPVRKLVVRAEDQVSDEEKAKMTSKLKDPASGKILGFVFISNRSV
jgi:folate-binding protein YgfZ